MNAKEIHKALEESRAKLLEAISGLTDEEMLTQGVVAQWSVKDILTHLTMWEAQLVTLLWQAAGGKTPTTIHFEKTNTDDINAQWTKDTQTRSLAQVQQDLAGVREQTLRRLANFSDKVLAKTNHFPWQKDKPLWKWIAEDSFEHETNHANEILQWRQNQ